MPLETSDLQIQCSHSVGSLEEDMFNTLFAARAFLPEDDCSDLCRLLRLLHAADDARIQTKVLRVLCNLCVNSEVIKMTLADLDVIPITLGELRNTCAVVRLSIALGVCLYKFQSINALTANPIKS